MWLKLKHVKTTRSIKKLDWIALPYRVLACIGTHAVQLNTPPGIHPVSHVSLVKKAAENPLPSQLTIDNEPGMMANIRLRGYCDTNVKVVDGAYLLNGLVGRSQLENHCNNSKRRRHWMHMSVYYMMLDLSYLGTALLLFIRDHKGGREGGNCDRPRPYSIARPYTRLQLT